MDKLNEVFTGCMYSILRKIGIPPTVEQLDTLKIECETMAQAFRVAAREESREMSKKLQGATLEAFKLMEKDIKDLEKRIDKIDEVASTEP